jgi:ATP-dependent Lon protease
MTGEITLRGHVLPIGGLKEKLLAAQRAGVKEVLVPKENVRDLELLPERVRKDMEIVPVSSMDEVLDRALIGECRPKIERPKPSRVKAGTPRKSAAERVETAE